MTLFLFTLIQKFDEIFLYKSDLDLKWKYCTEKEGLSWFALNCTLFICLERFKPFFMFKLFIWAIHYRISFRSFSNLKQQIKLIFYFSIFFCSYRYFPAKKTISKSPNWTPKCYFTPPLSVCSAAWIDKCRPDILISESTYATTIRDSKRCRERDFLKKVHESIERGGKVSMSDFNSFVCKVKITFFPPFLAF